MSLAKMGPGGFLEYYRSADGRRFLARQASALALTAVALLALFGASDLDRVVTGWFFDAARATFPLTNDWWLKTVLHDAARTTSALGALVLLAATAAVWLVPRIAPAPPWKHGLAFVCAASLTAAVAVALAKHFSSHACPWDIVDFGGLAPYRHLLAPHGALPPIEGCFPAAHPLAGYAWLGVGFALYPRARRLALLATVVVAVIGTALGLVQVMRGAHFLSHVLWSAWAVWGIDLALLALCCLGGVRAARARSARAANVNALGSARPAT